jgi:hypothetical protein
MKSTDAAVMPALLVATVAMSAAAPVSADPELDAARERWATAELVRYEYGYHKFCECHRDSPPETIVSVVEGRVTRVRHRPAGATVEVPAQDRNFDYYWTVDGLFDLVASAQGRGVEVRVAYDAVLGYPREVYIDYDADFIGDELDVRLTSVTSLPDAAGANE